MVTARELQSELSCSSAALAEIAEAITRRLEAGQPVDEERLLRDWPELGTRIHRLLPAIRSLADLAATHGAVAAPSVEDLQGPTVLAEFRLLREIGRGGMGIVYEAEQSPLGRRVALKVLPAAASLDERARQRFRLESQAAALLAHPSIVPVYTVGESGGVPYYAMQYIEGRSLAEILRELRRDESGREAEGYADDRARDLAGRLVRGRLEGPDGDGSDSRSGDAAAPSAPANGSSLAPSAAISGTSGGIRSRSFVRTIARLAVQGAEAIQYAHEQGVVHRDIKPANLLLDGRGKLWLTDFGLARIQAEEGLTRTGDLPGTLRYMSPEQAQSGAGPIDPRSDVYSLGATIYELLTLRPAISGGNRLELLHNIGDQAPRPIRQLNPSVPRDLATIVGRCLCKEPSGRYASAGALAEDLTRFLESRPILAHPVGPIERGVRWCRRKPALAAAMLALLVMLLGGMVGITLGWRSAVRQRDLLDLARHQATVERDLMEEQRQAAEAARARAETAEGQAREAAATAQAVKEFLTRKILLQARPEHSPARRQVTLLEVVDRGGQAVGEAFSGQPLVEAEIRAVLADTLHALGEFASAERHVRRAFELFRQHGGESSPNACTSAALLGELLQELGRHDESRRLLEQTRAVVQHSYSPDHWLAIRLDVKLGDLELARGNYAEAERLFRTALRASDRQQPVNPNQASGLRYRLARALQMQGQSTQSEPLFRESVEIGRAAFGPKAPATLAAINNLGTYLQSRGRLAEAEALFRENYEATLEVDGPGHPSTVAALENLGIVLIERGNSTEAEPLLREALRRSRAALGPDNPDTLYVQCSLAQALTDLGRFDEARDLARKSFAGQLKQLGPDHFTTTRSRNVLLRLGWAP